MARDSVQSFSGFACIALVLLIAGPASVGAAVFTVTNSCDGEPGCLRSCIELANSGDEIRFDAALDGERLCMACGEVVINKQVTITGRGKDSTILAGNNANRVFVFQPGAEGTEISGVTINSGWGPEGAGILVANHGRLTVRDSNITGNYSMFGGGGISGGYDTRVELINTTVNGNRTNSNGGGIYIRSGEVVLKNSTVSGNWAWGDGGGIYGERKRVKMTILSSTITDNSAVGDVGGVYLHGKPGDLTIANSIVANQASGADCAGLVTSLGYNLDSDGTCGFTAATDQPGVDPLLQPLSLNLGSTWTHVPMSGSPVIDRGVCQSVIDQRGVPRPLDGNRDGVALCDIGAVEFNPYLVHVRNPFTGEELLIPPDSE